MPHTLPGSSSINPSSQSFAYFPKEIQLTTRPVTLVMAGRPCSRTAPPNSYGTTAAHCAPPQVYEDYLTRLGKRMSRVQTGQRDGNLARDSSASPRLRFIEGRTHFQGLQNGKP